MSSHRTAEESKQHYIEQLGDELGSVFYALYNELVWQHVKWNEYEELFGTKQSRIELINRVSPLFFKIAQDALWDDSLLNIARITDPPKSAGKHNLTIQKLPDLVEEELKDKVLSSVNKAIEKSSFCRDRRNRKLAHKDLSLALKDTAKPLEPASRKNVGDALSSIATVLNTVVNHYMDTTIFFDIPSSPGGVNSLLYVLDDGLKAEEARRQRLKDGKFREEDYGPRNL